MTKLFLLHIHFALVKKYNPVLLLKKGHITFHGGKTLFITLSLFFACIYPLKVCMSMYMYEATKTLGD